MRHRAPAAPPQLDGSENDDMDDDMPSLDHGLTLVDLLVLNSAVVCLSSLILVPGCDTGRPREARHPR